MVTTHYTSKFRFFTVPVLFCFLLPFLGCAPDDPNLTLEVANNVATFTGSAFPEGTWQATIEGVTEKANPGQQLSWGLTYTLDAERLHHVKHLVEKVGIALAARRMNDAEGIYRDQEAYYYSTYLTPSGLPVEGFQYFIANSHVGGPYITPLDSFQEIPKESITWTETRLRIHAPLQFTLSDDFPPGIYRVEVALFAMVEAIWLPLPVLQAADLHVGGCDLDYERVFYAKMLLPPMQVGRIKPPRIIWTLFTSRPNHGIAGVVAKEDQANFAISSRVKLPSRYMLPCTPDRGECIFPLEPELPTVLRSRIFFSKEYLYRMHELDYSKGHVTVSVKRPDGSIDDLGTHRLTGLGRYGPKLGSKLNYNFDQYGRYEIEMTGEMFDRFGNRYQAGGTYEVWIAHPLTFATGIKPGTPLRVGQYYSPAATINPPVPAEVTATISFFPGTHPQDAITEYYSGTAQTFGYFFPTRGWEPFFFPEPGEYLYDVFATYTDDSGRVFMGHMKNASVVFPQETNMTVLGSPPFGYRLDKVVSNALDGSHSKNQGNLLLPEHSGDMLYFHGNANVHQAIQPAVSVEEPTGYLHAFLKENFPTGLVRLSNSFTPTDGKLFPGCQEQMHYFAESPTGDHYLPLMSATTRGYSPYEYPELVDRRGYFYIASSRPGFPIYFLVADSTMPENYWYNGIDDYMGTVGAAKRGDQPGDVNWTLVNGFFSDHTANRDFYGVYGSGGVAVPRGENIDYVSPPFQRPVATFNGVDLFIYGGVGPSPGTIYETGAVKGVGSIAVPMAPHDVEIIIHKPDGDTHDCRGRADEVGNFVCPNGPIRFDKPGVYRVFTHFTEKGVTGNCAGSRAGWYNVYAVEKDSPYRVLFDPQIQGRVLYDQPLTLSGRVEPKPARGTFYYSIVTPGILMDEGEHELIDGRFEFPFLPEQFGAEFLNLHDNVGGIRNKYFHGSWRTIPDSLAALFNGNEERRLSDTIEIDVFVEGLDNTGESITAAAKLVLRGDRLYVPARFLDHPGGVHE